MQSVLLEKDRELRILMWKSIKLAFAFVVLNIVDGILVQLLVSRGGYGLNPLMIIARELGTGQIFWLVKISGTVAFTFLLLYFVNRYPREVTRIFHVLVFAMIGICIFNGIGMAL